MGNQSSTEPSKLWCRAEGKNLEICTSAAGGSWGQKRVGCKSLDWVVLLILVFVSNCYLCFFHPRRKAPKSDLFWPAWSRTPYAPEERETLQLQLQRPKPQSHFVESFPTPFLNFPVTAGRVGGSQEHKGDFCKRQGISPSLPSPSPSLPSPSPLLPLPGVLPHLLFPLPLYCFPLSLFSLPLLLFCFPASPWICSSPCPFLPLHSHPTLMEKALGGRSSFGHQKLCQQHRPNP